MATSAAKGKAKMSKTDVEALLQKLRLSEAKKGGVVLAEKDRSNLPEVKWMAMAKLLTVKDFSPNLLFNTMLSTWNSARNVSFRPIGKNLFVVQALCLGDWKRIMKEEREMPKGRDEGGNHGGRALYRPTRGRTGARGFRGPVWREKGLRGEELPGSRKQNSVEAGVGTDGEELKDTASSPLKAIHEEGNQNAKAVAQKQLFPNSDETTKESVPPLSHQYISPRERKKGAAHSEGGIGEITTRPTAYRTFSCRGDKNTTFFHLWASRRRKRNKIVRLKKSCGQFTVNEQELGEVTTEFYKSLLLRRVRRIWKRFLIRSAYRMLVTKRSMENRAARSNVRAEEKEWTMLWGIKLTRPPRVERFPARGVPSRWIPPPTELMKINVDAALSKNSGIASAATIARDAVGSFMGASAVVLEGISDPETMKAIACKEGLALASDLAMQKFRLACDSANVIKSLRESGMGAYGHIVREIKARARDFTVSEFVHEGMGLWTLLEGFLLLANALAILNEDRFLAPRGWSMSEVSGNGQTKSLKGQIVGLIYATQFLRMPLIALNVLIIVVKLVSG
ncbi:hypothetical protein PR202_ga25833 [Eleusine coracana subsp. coracana]|nr:hypothetical protein PR202_ga25833 [Eleusine coracana subsp. coracana]